MVKYFLNCKTFFPFFIDLGALIGVDASKEKGLQVNDSENEIDSLEAK